ncbi:MAG: TIGR01440 family protein [Acidaminococcaceae bacterium]
MVLPVEEIKRQVKAAAEELIEAAEPKPGQVFVVGCSTSEVLGNKIGTAGSLEAAQAIFDALKEVICAHDLYLAVQCCEHLNRSLVTEAEAAEKYCWEEVAVRPVAHAGGSLAQVAYDNFDQPIVVEKITAHLGIDIGQTLIGMHLKRVAVPVRLSQKEIGAAILTAARTRPPYVGGLRAVY